MPLYEKVPTNDCWQHTGKAPISTKFVDLQKGDLVRSRLVVRNFKPKGEKDREDLFAAMPPLDAKKVLFRKAARQRGRWVGKKFQKKKMMLIDVQKAHLNGVVPDGVFAYVELPPEANAPGMCGRLIHWLYGMRQAASAWEKDYTDRLESIGVIRGNAAPTAFYHPGMDCSLVVHGDDFTLLGWEEDLRTTEVQMRGWYGLKVRGVLGVEAGNVSAITILNRELRWSPTGVEYEADRKHSEIIIQEMGLGSASKDLNMPCVKDDVVVEGTEAEEDEYLADDEAARANYLAQDRTDIQFATKELCRHMSRPRRSSWLRLKRLARYLLDHPRLNWGTNRTAATSPTSSSCTRIQTGQDARSPANQRAGA